ncbi:hypothetical protein C8R45DRAFT_946967 [Mycena sanguinolenta]|nr:hypothetical protein C8R45DRAFT_946967 [Mycena sanguinolenta]
MAGKHGQYHLGTSGSSLLVLFLCPKASISLYCNIGNFSGLFWITLEGELQHRNDRPVCGRIRLPPKDFMILLAITWLSESRAAREKVSIRHTERVDGAPPPIYIISRSLPEHDVIATRLPGMVVAFCRARRLVETQSPCLASVCCHQGPASRRTFPGFLFINARKHVTETRARDRCDAASPLGRTYLAQCHTNPAQSFTLTDGVLHPWTWMWFGCDSFSVNHDPTKVVGVESLASTSEHSDPLETRRGLDSILRLKYMFK